MLESERVGAGGAKSALRFGPALREGAGKFQERLPRSPKGLKAFSSAKFHPDMARALQPTPDGPWKRGGGNPR